MDDPALVASLPDAMDFPALVNEDDLPIAMVRKDRRLGDDLNIRQMLVLLLFRVQEIYALFAAQVGGVFTLVHGCMVDDALHCGLLNQG